MQGGAEAREGNLFLSGKRLLNPNFARLSECHCEERSEEAIPSLKDCFAVARNDRNGKAFQKPLRNPGLYNHPNFIDKESQEADYLRLYARYVQERN